MLGYRDSEIAVINNFIQILVEDNKKTKIKMGEIKDY